MPHEVAATRLRFHSRRRRAPETGSYGLVSVDRHPSDRLHGLPMTRQSASALVLFGNRSLMNAALFAVAAAARATRRPTISDTTMRSLRPYRTVLESCSLLICACLLGGCPSKAGYFRNDHGGYRLVSEGDSVQQAMARFHRTADDLCPGQAQDFSDLHLIPGTDDNWQIDLRCSGQSPGAH